MRNHRNSSVAINTSALNHQPYGKCHLGLMYCPVTCGGGVQRRNVWCEDQKTRERVADAECSSVEKPSGARECAIEKCRFMSPLNDHFYKWHSGNWTPVRRNKMAAAARRRRPPIFDNNQTRRLSFQQKWRPAPRMRQPPQFRRQ
ncbi:unnamed protein product [Toxocara canis]|uniref:Uncharacterized protein n=1 Tax=Toxocara canis TaxID=6265 RepID=A0A183U5V6_TOXCA|nr:unnamed protein product [Toxocara canis]